MLYGLVEISVVRSLEDNVDNILGLLVLPVDGAMLVESNILNIKTDR